MNATPQRVMVVDDDPALRRFLCRLIDRIPGFEVIAEAGDGQEALALAAKDSPAITLTDIQMPVMDGVELTRKLIELDPRMKIVALTGSSPGARLTEMVRNGAVGYLVKTAPPEEITQALQAVAQGHSVLSPEVTSIVLKDLVDNYQLEKHRAEELAELDAIKRNFISVVSHELRTPLAIIKGGTQALQGGSSHLDDEAKASLLGSIGRQSDRLERMVSQVLTVSKIENRSGESVLRSVRLADVIERAIRPLPQSSMNRLVLEVDGDTAVVGARAQLSQVLRWIIENALSFSTGAVGVTSKRPDELSLILEVRDEGVGMDESLLRAVLEEPFTQGDPSATRSHEGLGLSLFAARQVLQASGGQLTIESESGVGTIVSFHLRAIPERLRPDLE